MSSEIPVETPAVENASPTVEKSVEGQPPKKKRAVYVPPKIQKQIDSLKARHEKLVGDNKALKQQLAALKSSHSRIRRIPKPVAETNA